MSDAEKFVRSMYPTATANATAKHSTESLTVFYEHLNWRVSFSHNDQVTFSFGKTEQEAWESLQSHIYRDMIEKFGK